MARMHTTIIHARGHTFREGQRVRTRGDMGRFNLVIERIHNYHYATCRDLLFFGLRGRARHMNMDYLEPDGEKNDD